MNNTKHICCSCKKARGTIHISKMACVPAIDYCILLQKEYMCIYCYAVFQRKELQ